MPDITYQTIENAISSADFRIEVMERSGPLSEQEKRLLYGVQLALKISPVLDTPENRGVMLDYKEIWGAMDQAPKAAIAALNNIIFNIELHTPGKTFVHAITEFLNDEVKKTILHKQSVCVPAVSEGNTRIGPRHASRGKLGLLEQALP